MIKILSVATKIKLTQNNENEYIADCLLIVNEMCHWNVKCLFVIKNVFYHFSTLTQILANHSHFCSFFPLI